MGMLAKPGDSQNMSDPGQNSTPGMGEGGEGPSQDPSGTGGDGGDSAESASDDDAAALRLELAELRGTVSALREGTKKEDPAPAPVELPKVDFFSHEELEKIQGGDLAILNTGMVRGMSAVVTQILQTIPTLINQAVETKVSGVATRQEFFSKHEALNSPAKQAVLKYHADELARTKPGLGAMGILQEAAKLTYKEFGIQPPGTVAPKTPTGQGGTGGRSGGTPGRSATTIQTGHDPIRAEKEAIKNQVDDFFNPKD